MKKVQEELVESPELEPREIGVAKEVEADRLYLLHIRGSALEEARLFKAMMEKHHLSQRELVALLHKIEIPYTQPQISRLLSLLDLEPEFLAKIHEGEMAHTTGFELAKLPKEVRKKLLLQQGRITHIDVEEIKRDYLVTEDILKLVENPLPISIGDAETWWRQLTPSQKDRIYQLHQKEE